RGRLFDAGVLPLINTEPVVATGLSKIRTFRFLKTHGFAVPDSIELTEPSRLDLVTSLPCVVKPASGTSGSNLAFIAQDRDELAFFAEYIRRAGHTPLAQTYIGTPESEYTVGVLHGQDGSLLGSLALHRDLTRGLS